MSVIAFCLTRAIQLAEGGSPEPPVTGLATLVILVTWRRFLAPVDTFDQNENGFGKLALDEHIDLIVVGAGSRDGERERRWNRSNVRRNGRHGDVDLIKTGVCS